VQLTLSVWSYMDTLNASISQLWRLDDGRLVRRRIYDGTLPTAGYDVDDADDAMQALAEHLYNLATDRQGREAPTETIAG